jgi:hypothetical protein
MPTVQRYVEPYGVLGNPLADPVTRALLDAGDQGRVVDDAVEHLALRWLGRAHGGLGLARPRRERTATHAYRGALQARAGGVAARRCSCVRFAG